MLSIVSVGIEKYLDQSMGSIECARNDSIRVYNAFKNIMQDSFSEHSSICINNIFAKDLLHLLDSLCVSHSLDSQLDTLVIYFSGHATSISTYGIRGDYSLCLSDFNEEWMTGYLSLENDIAPVLSKLNCGVILILDCCYSGEGLSIASSHTGLNKISVLTATSERGLAEFSPDGSRFANAICESIQDIKSDNTDFTLNSLHAHIRKYYPSSNLNIATGHDNYLLNRSVPYSDYADFENRFLERVKHEQDKYKEAIWYSLIDLPEHFRKKVYELYFHCINKESNYLVEPNWLVRRAIGSSISCIEDERFRKELEKKLISSDLWQEQCIGIIGARYDISQDDAIFEYLMDKVSNHCIEKIDAVWLANLYAADNDKYCINQFVDTSLSRTSWGIQEIYKCAAKKGINVDSFVSVFGDDNDHILEWKKQYIERKYRTDASRIYRIMSQKNERGRLPINSKAKYILSTLYGSWRGHKLQNLKQYFEDNPKSTIQCELNGIQYFREVEYRMSIFEYLMNEPALFIEYSDSINWGLYDSHPWVRRTAIQAFKANRTMIRECNDSIKEFLKADDYQEIGVFDLLIEYKPQDANDFNEFVDLIKGMKSFSEAEINSISNSVSSDFSLKQGA